MGPKTGARRDDRRPAQLRPLVRADADGARQESRWRRDQMVHARGRRGLCALLREVFARLPIQSSLRVAWRQSAHQQMVRVRQGGLETEWHLLLNGYGAVVCVGKKSAARRSEPLHLLSRHGAGSKDEQILGQWLLSTRTGQRLG